MPRSLESMSLALDAAEIGTWVWDIRANQIVWDANIYRIHRVEPGAFGGSYEEFLAHVHPADRELVKRTVEQALKGPEGTYELEFHILWPDGELRRLETRGKVTFEGEEPIRMTGAVWDVTERHRGQQRFHQLASATNQMIWATDPTGHFREDCPSWREFTGQSEDEFRSDEWLEAVHPDDRAQLLSAWKGFELFEMEFRLRRADGVYRFFQMRAVPVLEADRDTIYEWVGTCSDITERKEAEQKLLRVNEELRKKNEEIEAFVYIVSHDLRAPLVNLQGFARELEMSCSRLHELMGGSEEAREILETDIPGSLHYITASSNKFDRLIKSLLQLSRVGRLEYHPKVVDMDLLAQLTLDILKKNVAASKASIELLPMPRAWGDFTALGQLWSNLVNNALKYLDPERPGKIQLGGERLGDLNRYWVRDNGVGIPDSAREKVFQVFSRLHPEMADGEGMGLAIVKRVVERHLGELWFESEPGVGTTFYFTLPSEGNQRAL